MKINNRLAKISLYTLIIVGITTTLASIVSAHTTIPTAPTTSCGSLDSLDLSTHATNQVDSRLTGKASSTDWTIFTTRGTGSGTTYVRNTNVWTNGGSSSIDWTGISPYNTSGGYHMPGTLISPRHVLMAAHYAASVGSKMYFVDNDNVVYERTLMAAQNVPGEDDVQIGVLDSDLPDSVTYYPIMSSENLKTFLTRFVNETATVPIVSFDQEKKAIVRSLFSLTGFGGVLWHTTFITGSSSSNIFMHGSAERSMFSESIVSGDSGNPNFILIDGQAVLLGDHHGTNWFVNLGFDISAVNTVMTSLGGGYQVSQYTPGTCFTNYAPQNNVPTFDYSYTNILTVNQYNFSSTTVLRTYTATDADIGQTKTYTLDALTSRLTSGSLVPTDYFSIDSSTGELTQKNHINTSVYGQTLDLTVKVTDNGTYSASSTITSMVAVYDTDGSVAISPASQYISTSTNQTAVRAITVTDSGDVFMAPNTGQLSFRELSYINIGNIVKMGNDGLIDTTFVNNQGIGASSTVSGGILIYDIYQDSEAGLILSGSFSQFNDATSSRIARLNADGTFDTAFASNTGSGLAGGIILRSLPFGNKIMSLSSFPSTTFNGNAVSRLMMLNSDGTFDASFSAAAGTSLSGINSNSFDFIKYSDTQAIVASNFTSYNGTTAGRLARINIDGTLDTAFNTAIGTGLNSTARALAKMSDGRILVGGLFTSFNGQSVPFMVMLNSDGTLNTSFMTNIGTGPNSSSNLVFSVQSDDKIVVGGAFTSFNGTSTPSSLIRLNSDGTIDSTFTAGLGLGYGGASVNVINLKSFSDDRLAVYGNYETYNDSTTLYGFHVLETTTPAIVSNLSISNSTDSGQYSNDNITKDAVLSFNGSGTPSSVVYLENDGTTFATTTVDLDGSWSTSASLSEGSKSITAFETLSVLNTATSTDGNALSLTIDRTAPALSESRSANTDKLYLEFTENIATSSGTSTLDWVVYQNNTYIPVYGVAYIGSTVYLSLDVNLLPGVAVTVTYRGTSLKDVAGNKVGAFNFVSVTNNTLSGPSVAAVQAGGGSSGGGGGGVAVILTVPKNTSSTTTTVSTAAVSNTIDSSKVPIANVSFKYKINKDVISIKFRNITLGSTGVDVQELQKFLNNNGYAVSTTGVGSKGKESRYFGAKTKEALARLQKAVGITPAVGYFGPVTKKYILSH